MFNINCSYSDQLNRLFRFESNLTIPKAKRVEYRPNSLALEHINSCNPTNSEVINSVLLNPHWITGFCDGEGSFILSIYKNKEVKIKVQVLFQIELHKKDRSILEFIKTKWGVGTITDKKTDVNLTVARNNEIKVLIDHFNKYPLKRE